MKGDDMGLGKTFQVTVFLTSMMKHHLLKRVLIIAPVSVLESWKRELYQHLVPHVSKKLTIEVASSEMNKIKRKRILHNVFDESESKRQYIIISSYHLVANMTEEFADIGDWDYVS